MSPLFPCVGPVMFSYVFLFFLSSRPPNTTLNNNNASQAGVLSDLNSESGTKNPFINIRSVLYSSWNRDMAVVIIPCKPICIPQRPPCPTTHTNTVCLWLLIKPATNTREKQTILHSSTSSLKIWSNVGPTCLTCTRLLQTVCNILRRSVTECLQGKTSGYCTANKCHLLWMTANNNMQLLL